MKVTGLAEKSKIFEMKVIIQSASSYLWSSVELFFGLGAARFNKSSNSVISGDKSPLN